MIVKKVFSTVVGNKICVKIFIWSFINIFLYFLFKFFKKRLKMIFLLNSFVGNSYAPKLLYFYNSDQFQPEIEVASAEESKKIRHGSYECMCLYLMFAEDSANLKVLNFEENLENLFVFEFGLPRNFKYVQYWIELTNFWLFVLFVLYYLLFLAIFNDIQNFVNFVRSNSAT